MTDRGYIYIPNWDRFQHYKDRRPAWIKLHLDLLGNDAWHELSGDDTKLLLTVWMLVARYGNGRIKVSLKDPEARSKRGLKEGYGWLMAQASLSYGPRSRNLERLIEAGLIEIRASKALAPRYQNASPEKEGSYEPKRESAASSARRNGAALRRQQRRLETAVATARAWAASDPDHLEADVRDNWPDDADSILAAIGSISAENAENGSNHQKPAPQEPISAPPSSGRDLRHAENQPDLGEITDDDIPF